MCRYTHTSHIYMNDCIYTYMNSCRLFYDVPFHSTKQTENILISVNIDLSDSQSVIFFKNGSNISSSLHVYVYIPRIYMYIYGFMI